jgi:hypothetical protein
MKTMGLAAVMSAIVPLVACGQVKEGTGDGKGAISVTIYSSANVNTFDPQRWMTEEQAKTDALPGYAVVREVRKIDLVAGDNAVRFADVAAGIDPTTVRFRSLTAPETTAIREQSFQYDLASPDKLLQKYVGRNILINRKQEPLKDDKSHTPETIQGKLLSYDANTFVLQTDNKQLPVEFVPRSADLSEIKLFDLENGLITRPTLLWKVRTDTAGAHDAQVTYTTDRMTWRADYSLVLDKDETAAEFGGWATVVNQSGADFANARITLVSGDVRPADTSVVHGTYVLSQPVSIVNNSVKQVELFPLRGAVPISRRFVFRSLNKVTVKPGQVKEPSDGVAMVVRIKNAEGAGLGMALPAGRVRVYQRGDGDAEQMLGAGVIGETAVGGTVETMTAASGLRGERRETELVQDGEGRANQSNSLSQTVTIRLQNNRQTAVTLEAEDDISLYPAWEITKSSDKYEKVDPHLVRFMVEVPAGGEKTVEYRVKYN